MGIHPKSKVYGRVEIGENSFVDMGCVIFGPVEIGDNTHIQAGTIIGAPPEHKSKESKYGVVIGNNCVIGTNCTITASTDERPTTIDDGCYLMSGVHVSHDCWIQENATLAHKVVLAGHVVVGREANIGVGSMVHQHTTIGGGCMVGMGSVVVKDVYPFIKIHGNPAKYCGLNHHRLKRFRSYSEDVEDKDLFSSDLSKYTIPYLVEFHDECGKRGRGRIIAYPWVVL